MNLRHISLSFLLALAITASAANEKTTVKQVTDAITLTTDVDYIITDTTPFATSGSVNIEDTDHAVVIIKNIKPSLVIKNWLSHIYIKGEKAVNGTNCQVKMYAQGAIILPYDKDIRPLTCYTEPNYAGTACTDYTEGHSDGFMKSLNDATLNNQIRSFRLKRGYMVTFALGKSGWGYSRCFIADQEDLEIANMPKNMDMRVSSYRLFKWQNAQKKGLASDGRKEANQTVNSSWCYDWAQGNDSNLPDTEWVPNHIYEDWPSASTCGSVTGSCHMKTNNEPGNSADDHPQSVDVVLDNWQNLMRTGMRLCSESSHDGSMNHLKAFIDSIDARGWRCDILDLHCYWPAGTFNNLTWYSDHYGNGRPIWISEWVWGASWNNNGIFATDRSYSKTNQQKCYEGTKPILEELNRNSRVERYAYWNSEADCSKIYKDGKLTILGEYYAKMESGLGYNPANEFIPKVVTLAPKNLEGSYNKSKGEYTLTWNDANGDMLDSLVIECKRPGSSKYEWLGSVVLKDMNGKNGAQYTFTDTPAAGATYYRIGAYPIGGKTAKYSGEVSVSISSSEGNSSIQFGRLSITNSSAIATDFSEAFTTTPAVFMGLYTNKNTRLYPSTLLTGISNKKFTYQLMPWTQQTSSSDKIEYAEELSFLALQDTTNYLFGTLDCEVGNAKVDMKDTTYVTFRRPFPEDVKPVVITELRNPSIKTNAFCTRIWDVTNEGFKMINMYEEGVGKTSPITQTMCYLAITPGQGTLYAGADVQSTILSTDTIAREAHRLESGMDSVILTIRTVSKVSGPLMNIYVGHGTDKCYGTTYRSQSFLTPEGDQLYFSDPYMFGALQTYNYHAATILRRSSDIQLNDNESPYYQYITGSRIKRQIDSSSTTKDKNTSAYGDEFGWIVLNRHQADNETITTLTRTAAIMDPTAIHAPMATDATPAIYRIDGTLVPAGSELVPGIYIVREGGKVVKRIVKN